MKKINIETNEAVFKEIVRKLPWLGYDSFEQFVNDAVKLRTIVLLRVANMESANA